ncbi:TrmH family RNA methyltransferase, partial [Paraburkholderia sp. BCC1876]|uniref:TrmH family RNA methyltransferase n=1 Tax=Paraburkholderia sp. BCC1876 TaxID=2676303 RepID=UPI0024456A43
DTVPYITVTNLARALRELKDAGVWVIGTADDAGASLYETKLDGPVALVMGAEGEGMRRLTRDTCDDVMNIPMAGSVESLNVTVARLARVAGARAAFASRVLVFGCAAALLAACASPTLVDRDGYVADTSHPARGTDSRVRFLVLHYTESDDQRALFVLTHNEVSAHYLVPSHP